MRGPAPILARDPGRALTAGERRLAAEMFGDALDPARVRLHRRRWWPFQPANVAMAPDGHVWFAPEGPLWRDDFAAAPLSLQALFVHELTHCWQVQHGGGAFLLLMRHPFCRYAYRYRPGRPFRRYGIEQQAEIVAHAFLLRRGAHVAHAPAPAALETLLPWRGAPPTPWGEARVTSVASAGAAEEASGRRSGF